MDVAYQPRLIDGVLARRLAHHPAVMLVGPRTTGKTTTAARHAGSEVRLDDRAQALAAEAERAFRLGEDIAAAPIAALWS